MAFEATAIFELVMHLTWAMLDNTPSVLKNALYAQFFTSQEIIEKLATTLALTFAPGLFEVLQAATPPSVEWFKSLPEDQSDTRQAVYVLVMEKFGCPVIIYEGSGTNQDGAHKRLVQYDSGYNLPKYVQSALDDGYSITHKGLLCWIPKPAFDTHLLARLLMVLLEALFSHVFWTMKSKEKDYGMGHACFWDRETFGYDGACSHSCLNEAVTGDFDLTKEQLLALCAAMMRKNAHRSAIWRQNQIAFNLEEYRAKTQASSAESRARDPERNRQTREAWTLQNLADKKYSCEPCNYSAKVKSSLQKHLDSADHRRVMAGIPKARTYCIPCKRNFRDPSKLKRHEMSTVHRKVVDDLRLRESSNSIATFFSREVSSGSTSASASASSEEDDVVLAKYFARSTPNRTSNRTANRIVKRPGSDAKQERLAIAKAFANGSFLCEYCNLPFGKQQHLDNHLELDRHKAKAAATSSSSLLV